MLEIFIWRRRSKSQVWWILGQVSGDGNLTLYLLTLQIVSGYHSAIEETGTRTKKTCFVVLHVLI